MISGICKSVQYKETKMYEYLKFNLGANNLDELNELGRARWCCVCSIGRTKNHDVLLLKRELPDELNAKGVSDG